MPAYFSLTFELNKNHHAIRDFCETLIRSGLVFKSGYWGFENDSFEDIFDFSEVRLFVMNNRKKRTFTFELIVPESDLLICTEEKEGKYSVQLKSERMEQLKSVAKKIWVGTAALAIQTGWELSDLPPLAEKIARGMKPQTEPFCIINSSSLEKEPILVYEYMERSGVLMEDKTKWKY